MSLVLTDSRAPTLRPTQPPLDVGLPRERPTERPMAILGVLGGALLGAFVLVALAAPLLAPYDPSAFVGRPLEWPSIAHWLGTNDVGQDILSEVIYGTRASLAVSIIAATASLVVAASIGTTAGYFGGPTDAVLMRLVDVLLTLPQLPLMIVLAAFLPPSLGTTIVVIGALGWGVSARVVRAQTLALRHEAYVVAAQQLGARSRRVIGGYLIPALGPVLAATFVAQASRAVALEAGLAFLGLGDPLLKSWGTIMHAALSYRGIYFTPNWSWWLLPAGLNISLLILAFTLLGVGLEERFDPRLRQRRRAR